MSINQAMAAIDGHIQHYRKMKAVRAADTGGRTARGKALARAAGQWEAALASLDALDPISRHVVAQELARPDPEDGLHGAGRPGSLLDQHGYAGAVVDALRVLGGQLQSALAAAATAEGGPPKGRPPLADEDWLVAQGLSVYERFTGHVPASTTKDGDSAFSFVAALLKAAEPDRRVTDDRIRDHIRRAKTLLKDWRAAPRPSAPPEDADAIALIRATWTRPATDPQN